MILRFTLPFTLMLGLLLACTHSVERRPSSTDGLREVFVVGNNWDGTVDIFDAKTYERIKKVDVVPDYYQRVRQRTHISKVVGRKAFHMISFMAGEGNLQLVDDMFIDRTGKFLLASRPSFSDVVKIDIKTGEIVGRAKCTGFRSDHATLSPDGKYFIVSCTSNHSVYAIDVASFRVVSQFRSGESPHENTFIQQGDILLHANIGNVVNQVTFRDIDWKKMSRLPAEAPSAEKQEMMDIRRQPAIPQRNFPLRDSIWVARNSLISDKPLQKLGEEYKTLKLGGDYVKKIDGETDPTMEWKDFNEYGLNEQNLMWLDNEFKGGRHLYMADFSRKGQPRTRRSFGKVRKIDMGERLHEYFKRHPLGASASEGESAGQWPVDKAIRPMAVFADERHILLQISFFHGFFKYRLPDFNDDTDLGEITAAWELPIPAKVKMLHSWEYQLNSAHHGIAINKKHDPSSPTGYSSAGIDRACVAMTMSGSAAIVNLNERPAPTNGAAAPAMEEGTDYWLFPLVWDPTADPTAEDPGQGFTREALEADPTAAKPYWATETEDGTRCLVSVSQQDKVFVINFGTAETPPFVEAILSVGENREGQRVAESTESEAYQVPSIKYVAQTGTAKLAQPIKLPLIQPLERAALNAGKKPRDKSFLQGALYPREQLSLSKLPYAMTDEERSQIRTQYLSHPQRIRNGKLATSELQPAAE